MRGTLVLRHPAVTGYRAKAAAATAVAAFVAYAGAQRLLTGGLTTLLLLAAVGVAAFVLEKPRGATLVMLVVSAPLVQVLKTQLHLGGLTTDAFEVFAYALVARWVVSRGREEPTPSWRFAAPVLLLVAGATVGLGYSVLRGGDRFLAIGQYKSYLVYLLVLPLTALFATTRDKERLERWVVRFCTFGSVVVLVAAAVGSELPTEAPELPLNTFGVTTQVQRIRPAMLWLLFLATLLVLGKVFTYGLKRADAVRLTLYALVWVFSFNRSSWGALLVCGGLLALVRPGVRSPGRGLRTVAVASLVVPLFLSIAATGALGRTLSAVPARLESLVNPKVAQEDAVQDRASEYPAAVAALERSPVVGVGLGRSYGARRPFYDPRLGVVVYEDRPFSHNSLLFAYLQTGLLGVAALVLLGVAGYRAAVEARKRLPTDVALRVVTGSVALLGYGIQSLSQTSLLHRPGITALVVSMVLATRPREFGA
ncbi:MAG TPA: O-antigen ligase family protein [Mycobacteriales bacterium]|jgi:hypothetical protein|nr:O-antigen ligase family protein [Mycobacteriales bacterium]